MSWEQLNFLQNTAFGIFTGLRSIKSAPLGSPPDPFEVGSVYVHPCWSLWSSPGSTAAPQRQPFVAVPQSPSLLDVVVQLTLSE